MINLANGLKLLGDETRLRILRLLAREPVNVSELTAILGLAQSGVSRHLGLLRQAGLVEERPEGPWSYYALPDAAALEGAGAQLYRIVLAALEQVGDPYGDQARLAEALRRREEAGVAPTARFLEPGQSWYAFARALLTLLPALDAIDLGCGDGTLTLELARGARSVLGVDVNPAAIQAAERRAAAAGLANARFRVGRIEALAEPAAAFDLALLSQSLHHLPEPGAGLAEAARVLRPGGRVVVTDLAPHQERWVVEKLGHAHLGFAPEALARLLGEAGFTDVRVEPVPPRRGEVFRVLVATGV
ncbi:MAG: metalloregulator ArsR/SmtB family transcription factor, partial [Candidatus Lambdaproteobacteria bacterium]|nr:metalloregulator ArsR/SmtB family transcription factor [Candidatus Lambdaproteobacteria bacterium]